MSVLLSRVVLARAALACTLLTLAACATAPPDHGARQAATLLHERGVALPEAVVSVPAGVLSRDDVVRATLSGHPALRVVYAQLDIAAADVVRAGERMNPRLSLSLLRPHGGGSEWGVEIAQELATWLLRPARQRLARDEYELAVLALGQALLELALRADAAWFDSVAAAQALALQQQATRAAVLTAALAERYHAAGNLSELELAQWRDRAAEARLAERQRQRDHDRAQWRLARLMGVDVAGWSVPAQLPLPLPAEPEAGQLLVLARAQHLELRARRQRAALLADAAELARRYRWLGELELGLRHEREADGQRLSGPLLALSLPLWQRNASAVLHAEAAQHLAQAELEQRDRELALDVRAAVLDIQHARALFEQGRETLPLRAAQVRLRQERVGFMLDSPFELLSERQRELQAQRDLALLLGDYWRSLSALGSAVGAPLLPPGDELPPPLRLPAPTQTEAPEHGPPSDHHHHHHAHEQGGHPR